MADLEDLDRKVDGVAADLKWVAATVTEIRLRCEQAGAPMSRTERVMERWGGVALGIGAGVLYVWVMGARS